MKSGGSGSAVNQLINGNGNGGPAAGPTLAELAEKLSELREHVDQTVARLNALCNRDSAIPKDASTNADTFRCHECGEQSRADQSGWTLRLCGDDELHPFCPSCDRRHVSGIGGGTRPTATELSL
jgi:hypothetical protein